MKLPCICRRIRGSHAPLDPVGWLVGRGLGSNRLMVGLVGWLVGWFFGSLVGWLGMVGDGWKGCGKDFFFDIFLSLARSFFWQTLCIK